MRFAVHTIVAVAIAILVLTLAAAIGHVVLGLEAIRGMALDPNADPSAIAAESRALAIQTSILAGAFVGALTIVAVTILGFVIPPLHEFTRRMRQIGAGAFSERVTMGGYAELDDLALAMNEMAASLALREKHLVHAERLANLGTLVAGVAHEINNPLTYLRGNTELAIMDIEALAERPELPSEDREALHETLNSLRATLAGFDRIARISKSLKVVARAGRTERSVVDPGELVTACIVLAHSRFEGGVEARTASEARRSILCEPGEISQVILNLLLNAVEAMEGAGTLTVATRDAGDSVEISVADDGPGIPERVQPRLFHAFVSTKRTGTGLGLALSKQIVESHGGTIGFETGPRGTTFRIRLPAHAPIMAMEASAPSATIRG